VSIFEARRTKEGLGRMRGRGLEPLLPGVPEGPIPEVPPLDPRIAFMGIDRERAHAYIRRRLRRGRKLIFVETPYGIKRPGFKVRDSTDTYVVFGPGEYYLVVEGNKLVKVTNPFGMSRVERLILELDEKARRKRERKPLWDVLGLRVSEAARSLGMSTQLFTARILDPIRRNPKLAEETLGVRDVREHIYAKGRSVYISHVLFQAICHVLGLNQAVEEEGQSRGGVEPQGASPSRPNVPQGDEGKAPSGVEGGSPPPPEGEG